MATTQSNAFNLKSFTLSVGSDLESVMRSVTAKKIAPHKLTNPPQVSVIIVVYNGLPYLKNCLATLEQTDYPNYEIILVDNHSDKPTADFCKQAVKNNARIKYIRASENGYFSGGNNLGVEHSDPKSKYVVLLNSDILIVRPDWLSILVQVVYPRDEIISFGYASLPLRPDGYCMLIPRKIYQKLHGLDVVYKMNWGITDFTRRALLDGVKVSAIINARDYIIHLGGKSYTAATLTKQDTNKPSLFWRFFSVNWLAVRAVKVI